MDSPAAAGALPIGMYSCGCCISPRMHGSGGWCQALGWGCACAQLEGPASGEQSGAGHKPRQGLTWAHKHGLLARSPVAMQPPLDTPAAVQASDGCPASGIQVHSQRAGPKHGHDGGGQPGCSGCCLTVPQLQWPGLAVGSVPRLQ